MRKIRLQLITLGLAALLLSACDFVITGSVDIELLPPGFTVRNATFNTTYRAEVSGVDQFVICDNKDTVLAYSFDYSGTLSSWSSFLEGRDTGQRKGQATFTSADVVAPGRVEVTYTILAGGAPRLTAPELSSQAIVVVPTPTVVGYSQLLINVNDYNRNYPLSSNYIPVISNCPVP